MRAGRARRAAREHVRRGRGAPRERVDKLKAERDRLRRRLGQRAHGVEPLDGYAEFLGDEDVQAVIQEAKDQDYPSPKYVKGIIVTILDERGPVNYEEVADRIGAIRTNEVASAATTLESFGVVEKERNGGQRDGGPQRRRA